MERFIYGTYLFSISYCCHVTQKIHVTVTDLSSERVSTWSAVHCHQAFYKTKHRRAAFLILQRICGDSQPITDSQVKLAISGWAAHAPLPRPLTSQYLLPLTEKLCREFSLLSIETKPDTPFWSLSVTCFTPLLAFLWQEWTSQRWTLRILQV